MPISLIADLHAQCSIAMETEVFNLLMAEADLKQGHKFGFDLSDPSFKTENFSNENFRTNIYLQIFPQKLLTRKSDRIQSMTGINNQLTAI